MEILCTDCVNYIAEDKLIERNQKKTQWVVVITAFTMVLEVTMGYVSGSMALVADGWHMGSHAGALLIALVAYKLAKSRKMSRHFSFGAGKLIPLGGFTSAVILAILALTVFVESVGRLFSPTAINFDEAIGIACFGLCINILSVLILHERDHGHSGHDHHHHHHHHEQGGDAHKHVHDHNLRSAFLHILMDAVTSVLAIVALVLGKYYHFLRLDPLIGIVGAFVIFAWAYQLCRDTAWELLDGHSKTVDWARLRARLEVDGARILDFHVWRIAPMAIACELVVGTKVLRGLEYYRDILRDEFSVQHVIVEERKVSGTGK